MKIETKEYVIELTKENRSWTAERIAAWIQRGWSFLGVSRETYLAEKQEILDLVKEIRKE